MHNFRGFYPHQLDLPTLTCLLIPFGVLMHMVLAVLLASS